MNTTTSGPLDSLFANARASFPMRVAWCGLLLMLLLLLCVTLPAGLAQEPSEHHHHDMGSMQGMGDMGARSDDKEFSEFSHHLAGFFVLLMGLGELAFSLGIRKLNRLRWLLPAAMLGAGVYLLIWSDIDVWSMSAVFVQPFLIGDMETLQHKFYAVCLLAVGVIEWRRRQGRLTNPLWQWPLPLFAILGGSMLYAHMHNVVTDVQVIHMHHRLMGAAAILAGAVKLVPASGLPGLGEPSKHSSWETAWAMLVVLIGVELLLYFE